jgi:hypothetical protein
MHHLAADQVAPLDSQAHRLFADRTATALAATTAEGLVRLNGKTISQGCEHVAVAWLAGKPVRALARRSTNATVRNAPSYISLLKITIPRSRPTWRRREPRCRATLSASSRRTSNVDALNMVFYEFGAKLVTPNSFWRLAASGAVSVPAAVPVVWLTTAWMQEVERSRSQSRECGAAGR